MTKKSEVVSGWPETAEHLPPELAHIVVSLFEGAWPNRVVGSRRTMCRTTALTVASPGEWCAKGIVGHSAPWGPQALVAEADEAGPLNITILLRAFAISTAANA